MGKDTSTPCGNCGNHHLSVPTSKVKAETLAVFARNWGVETGPLDNVYFAYFLIEMLNIKPCNKTFKTGNQLTIVERCFLSCLRKPGGIERIMLHCSHASCISSAGTANMIPFVSCPQWFTTSSRGICWCFREMGLAWVMYFFGRMTSLLPSLSVASLDCKGKNAEFENVIGM